MTPPKTPRTATHLHPGTILARKKMLADRAAGVQSKSSSRITNASTHETYQGEDLRPFEGRPGAMDAYKLPSRGVRC